MTRSFALAPLLVCALGCAHANAARGGAGASGELSAEQLYRRRCGSCHASIPAHAYPASEWPGIVDRMRSPAALSDDEAARILGWLRGE